MLQVLSLKVQSPNIVSFPWSESKAYCIQGCEEYLFFVAVPWLTGWSLLQGQDVIIC